LAQLVIIDLTERAAVESADRTAQDAVADRRPSRHDHPQHSLAQRTHKSLAIVAATGQAKLPAGTAVKLPAECEIERTAEHAAIDAAFLGGEHPISSWSSTQPSSKPSGRPSIQPSAQSSAVVAAVDATQRAADPAALQPAEL
jgi:hypothetical protein